jgi:hypothetical protein
MLNFAVVGTRVEWVSQMVERVGPEESPPPGALEQDIAGEHALAAFAERAHHEDGQTLDAAVNRALQDGGDFEVEYRIVRPDGRIRWALSRGQVITDDAGAATRVKRSPPRIRPLRRARPARPPRRPARAC